MAMQRAVRGIQTMVEIEFANGSSFNLPAEFLRVYSPAVDGKLRTVGGEKVIFGRRHVGIMSAEPIGNYGVSCLPEALAAVKTFAGLSQLLQIHHRLPLAVADEELKRKQ
ncbi:Gamma-butyrobetaine hydroxylase-like, N-terminal, partial [Dillenia turbinata]